MDRSSIEKMAEKGRLTLWQTIRESFQTHKKMLSGIEADSLLNSAVSEMEFQREAEALSSVSSDKRVDWTGRDKLGMTKRALEKLGGVWWSGEGKSLALGFSKSKEGKDLRDLATLAVCSGEGLGKEAAALLRTRIAIRNFRTANLWTENESKEFDRELRGFVEERVRKALKVKGMEGKEILENAERDLKILSWDQNALRRFMMQPEDPQGLGKRKMLKDRALEAAQYEPFKESFARATTRAAVATAFIGVFLTSLPAWAVATAGLEKWVQGVTGAVSDSVVNIIGADTTQKIINKITESLPSGAPSGLSVFMGSMAAAEGLMGIAGLDRMERGSIGKTRREKAENAFDGALLWGSLAPKGSFKTEDDENEVFVEALGRCRQLFHAGDGVCPPYIKAKANVSEAAKIASLTKEDAIDAAMLGVPALQKIFLLNTSSDEEKFKVLKFSRILDSIGLNGSEVPFPKMEVNKGLEFWKEVAVQAQDSGVNLSAQEASNRFEKCLTDSNPEVKSLIQSLPHGARLEIARNIVSRQNQGKMDPFECLTACLSESERVVEDMALVKGLVHLEEKLKGSNIPFASTGAAFLTLINKLLPSLLEGGNGAERGLMKTIFDRNSMARGTPAIVLRKIEASSGSVGKPKWDLMGESVKSDMENMQREREREALSSMGKRNFIEKLSGRKEKEMALRSLNGPSS